MNLKIDNIKKLESPPKIIKNVFNKDEIISFLDLYKNLPVTIHNKKQNVIKKRWLQGYDPKLETIFCDRLKKKLEISKWIILKMKMVKIFMD